MDSFSDARDHHDDEWNNCEENHNYNYDGDYNYNYNDEWNNGEDNHNYNGEYYNEEYSNEEYGHYNGNYDGEYDGIVDVKEEEEEEETHNEDGWVAGFRKTYTVHSLSSIKNTHLEDCNKIIMPESAFEELMNKGVGFPMLFKIENTNTGETSHCGVLEFTGEEGVVVMPEWMMKNMSLEEGGMVNLENVTLDRATYLKLQPHSVGFLNIRSPIDVLEGAFSLGYACLTVGDTILIMHEEKKWYVDVVEALPSNAVCVIETDVEVDFACPLDYKEPEKPVSKQTEEEPSKFVPFTGRARRLNETDNRRSEELSAINDVLMNDVDLSKSKNKLVSGVGTASTMLKRSRMPSDTSLEISNTGKTMKPFPGKKYRLMD